MNLPELIQSVSSKIEALAPTNAPILVAVSGGVDSVVLARVLQTLGIPMGMAHVNFQLRGKESDEDENFVRNLAVELGCDIHIQRFDTQTYATQKGISIQMAARELRYDFFNSLIPPYAYIVTAHHANDSFETAIFNLTKGTGLAGVKGIPFFSGNRIRPLISIPKESIVQVATENGWAWREDASNAKDVYARNKLRHHVIPVLQEINPSIFQTWQTTQRRLEGYEKMMDFICQPLLQAGISEGTFSISIEKCLQLPDPVVCVEWVIRAFGFQFSDAVAIVLSFNHTESKVFYSKTHFLIKSGETLEIQPLQDEREEVRYEIHSNEMFQFRDGTLHFKTIEAKNYTILPDPMMLQVDAEKVTFPLILRPWKPADAMAPLGMGGKSKNISDILTDKKATATQKKNAWVLESKGDIVWLVGWVVSDDFKITTLTQHVLQVRFEPQ